MLNIQELIKKLDEDDSIRPLPDEKVCQCLLFSSIPDIFCPTCEGIGVPKDERCRDY